MAFGSPTHIRKTACYRVADKCTFNLVVDSERKVELPSSEGSFDFMEAAIRMSRLFFC